MPAPSPVPAAPTPDRAAGRRRRGPPAASVAAAAAALALLGAGGTAPRAQVPAVLQGGPPVQVQPSFPEPGIPLITITPGTGNPFAGIGGRPGGGAGPGGGGGGGGTVAPSQALTTILGTEWGAGTVDAAQSLGINPSAVAAMCVVESNCRNVTNQYGFTGPFQMGRAAYDEGLRTALAANPALASRITQGAGGIGDPFTNSVAAMGYMMQASQTLEARGVSNPTFVDARAYHNFGPSYGVRVAAADGSQTMASILPQSWLAPNGISPTMTVEQWRATAAAKVGDAAFQGVRI